MKARILTGSKKEIAEKVVEIDGEIREAIVFVDEPLKEDSAEGFFAEMEQFAVHESQIDDSREAAYRRMEGE